VAVHLWPLYFWLWSMAGWRASKTFSRCAFCKWGRSTRQLAANPSTSCSIDFSPSAWYLSSRP